MIDRNCTLPHELVCATDDPAGLDKEIRVAPLERQLIGIGNAYPKLAAFRPDAERLFGKRICVIDLDAVVVGPLDTLFDDQRDFIIWKDVMAASQPKRFKYNSSLILMNAGTRSEVWETFSAWQSPKIICREKRCGTDQAWVSHVLGDEAIWSSHDGVLSWRFDVRGKRLRDNAKIIFFHGKEKPWHLNDPIIKENWH